MLARILELKDALSLFASKHGHDNWGINYSLMPKILNALKPFKEATEKVYKINFPSPKTLF